MADMLNIAQSAYAYLESGKTTLSIDRLIKITVILDLDIHHVLDKSLQIRIPAHQHDSQKMNSTQLLFPETKEAYDLLIFELRSEIEFLRGLIKKA